MRIGEYEIVEGSKKIGGMAVVYQGQRQGDFKPKALKMIRVRSENECVHAALANRFNKELNVIGQLNDPHIVHAESVFMYIDPQNHPYTVLVMEWLDGLDMEEFVQKQGPITDYEQVTKIGKHILKALQYSHNHGVLHMDVKPSNVFRTKDGYIKLIDFGIAQVIGEQGENIQGAEKYIAVEKGESTFRGTEEYASPEQKFGQTPSKKSDIYSFGKTMQFICLGNTTEKTIPNDLWNKIFHKCTAPIEDRYANCEEVLKEIENADKKECIHCHKLILKDYNICPYCSKKQEYEKPETEVEKMNPGGVIITSNVTRPIPPATDITPKPRFYTVYCPKCGFGEVSKEPQKYCPRDGTLLVPGRTCLKCHRIIERQKGAYCIYCRHKQD